MPCGSTCVGCETSAVTTGWSPSAACRCAGGELRRPSGRPRTGGLDAGPATDVRRYIGPGSHPQRRSSVRQPRTVCGPSRKVRCRRIRITFDKLFFSGIRPGWDAGPGSGRAVMGLGVIQISDDDELTFPHSSGTAMLGRCRTVLPTRPRHTCSNTQTTRLTGGRGAQPRLPRPSIGASRSCCPWATRPATGVT